MLSSRDELRHSQGEDPNWRESLYFNFNDRRNGIGGWIYLWVLPNQPLATGMLVAFYHGSWPDPHSIEAASASPDHRLTRNGDWLYCVQRNLPELVDHDFDDFVFGGLQLKRLRPLNLYQLSFDDGVGNGFDFTTRFLTPPYDYAKGFNATPAWMAANRYHRAHQIKGSLRIGGEDFLVDCTGDSDHSWGQRDMGEFGKNIFKMWSLQSADHRLSLSVIDQGVGAENIALGFVSIDGEMASAKDISSRAKFDASAMQSSIDLLVRDEKGRSISARMPRMHSCVGWGATSEFWGVEGVGDFEVDGWGTAPGLTSYFWPSRIGPESLATGRWT